MYLSSTAIILEKLSLPLFFNFFIFTGGTVDWKNSFYHFEKQ
jgi:hypothetical protein